jgi:CMP-N-acetylneuraminic acid synthetase
MAKEGSIGLPGKNIWKIKDRTLLGWTIQDAIKSKLVDKVFVSTNGEDVAKVAKAAGAEVIMRDNELAKNEKFMQAVEHAVELIKGKHPDLEIIAIPQCVVPFRDPDIFDRCMDFLLKNPDYDSVVTIRQVGFIPEALMKMEKNQLVPYFPDTQKNVSGSRQDSCGYEIDHTVECFTYNSYLKRAEGIKPWSYLGKKIMGIKQEFHNHNCFVDVHTMDDIHWLSLIVDHCGFDGMRRSKETQGK